MDRSPVSILVELFPKNPPVFTFEGEFYFTCKVVADDDLSAYGKGKTKRLAKSNAAAAALSLLNARKHAKKNTKKKNKKEPIPTNYVSCLNEHSMSNGLDQPRYMTISGTNCPFAIECSYIGFTSTGEGPNRKVAKHEAAKLICERFKSMDPPTQTELLVDSLKEKLERESELNAEVKSKKALEKYNELKMREEEARKREVEEKEREERLKRDQEKQEQQQMDLAAQGPFNKEVILEKIRRRGKEYIPVEIQSSPKYILALSFGKMATVLGMGDTREEAEEDLLKEADMILLSNIWQCGLWINGGR